MHINDLSRLCHKTVRGRDESFCSWAYHHQAHPFWAAFVRVADAVFGEGHCRNSHKRYH